MAASKTRNIDNEGGAQAVIVASNTPDGKRTQLSLKRKPADEAPEAIEKKSKTASEKIHERLAQQEEDIKEEVKKGAKPGTANRSKFWVWTSWSAANEPWNNLGPKEQKKVQFMIYCKQKAPNPKPGTDGLHWQGYLEVKASKGYTRGEVVNLFNSFDEDIHVERRTATAQAAIRYITDDLKATNVDEPVMHGKPSDYNEKEDKKGNGKAGSRKDLIGIIKLVEAQNMSKDNFFQKYPDQWGTKFAAKVFDNQYSKKEIYVPKATRAKWYDEKGEIKDKVFKRLIDFVALEDPDRKMMWIWSEKGGTGKSMRAKGIYNHSIKAGKKAKIIGSGAADKDVAVIVAEDIDTYIFDFSRSTETKDIPWAMLESIMNGVVTQGKYESVVKHLEKPAHVIVFANIPPDPTKISRDRFDKTTLCIDPVEVRMERRRAVGNAEVFTRTDSGWESKEDMAEQTRQDIADIQEALAEANAAKNFVRAGVLQKKLMAKEAVLKAWEGEDNIPVDASLLESSQP